MPAFLILVDVERKHVMNTDSPLHHPEGRERRGKGKKEGGREGGRGERSVNNPARTSGKSHAHEHITHTHTPCTSV